MTRRLYRSVGAGSLAAVIAACLGLGMGAGPATALPKPKYPTRVEDIPKAETSAKPAETLAPAETAAEAAPAPTATTRIETTALAPAAAPDEASEAPRSEPVRAEAATPRPVLTFDTPATAPEPVRPTPAAVSKPAARKPAGTPAAKPAKTAEAPAMARPLTYTVQSGDTLSGVARRFGVPLKTLMEANKLASAASVKAGAKLSLPAEARDSGKDPYATGPAVATPAAQPPVQKAAAVKPAPTKPAPTSPAKIAAKPAAKPVELADSGQTAAVAERPGSTRPATPAPTPKTAGVAANRSTTSLPSFTPPPLVPTSGPFPNDGQLRSLGQGRFVWPVKGEVLSPFGQLGPGLRNDGLNISSGQGVGVRAAAAGEVVYAGDAVPGYGNLVLIKHADGWVTAYGHLSRIGVRMKQKVEQGDTIGEVGQTGGVDRPQLHFEVRYAPSSKDKARPIDPGLVLP